MASVFEPSIKLSNLISFKSKFSILSLIGFIPLIIFAWLLISSQLHSLAESKGKVEASRYIEPLRSLLEHVAQTRGMTNAYLNGNEGFLDKIRQKKKTVEDDFKRLLIVDKELSTWLQIPGQAVALKNQWSDIDSTAMSGEPSKVFSSYVLLIKNILDFMDTVSRKGSLNRDSDSINNYIINSLIYALPIQVENLGQLRGKGAGVIAAKDFSLENKLIVSSLSNDKNFLQLNKNIRYIFDEDRALEKVLGKSYTQAQTKLTFFLELTNQEIISNSSSNMNSAEYFSHGSQAISELLNLFDAMLPVLIERLNTRMDQSEASVLFYQSLLIVVMLMLIYAYISIYKAINLNISAVRDAADKLCDGDLDVRLSITTKDEFKYIATSFNEIAIGFSRSIISIKQASTNISKVASEIAKESYESAEGIKRQSDELEQTSTAITEMSASISEVAQNTELASEAASKVNDEASKGGNVVSDSVNSINILADNINQAVDGITKLEEHSQSISTILDVIRGIAEQTNLLALNAAIEAARAGEQGRGFAVVADEVRTLAKRTQDSTLEIHNMIEVIQTGISDVASTMGESKDHADVSVEHTNKAGEALATINQAVSEITEMSTQVAAAAEEQSCVSDEISKSIVSISDVSKVATAGAQVLAEAGSRLAAMSDEMNLTVRRYTIDSGEFEINENASRMLKWQHAYDLGIEEADRQHKKLIMMMNDVHILSANQRSGEAIAQALDSLIQFTEVHFEWEEKLFDSYEYPESSQHKAAHRQLVMDLRQHQKNIQLGSLEEVDNELNALNDWLIKHIEYSDQDYAKHIKQHKRSA